MGKSSPTSQWSVKGTQTMSDNQANYESPPPNQPGETERMLAKMVLPILVYLVLLLLTGIYLALEYSSNFETARDTGEDAMNLIMFFISQFLPGILLLRFALAAKRAPSMQASDLPAVLKRLLYYWWCLVGILILSFAVIVIGLMLFIAGWV